MEYKPTEATKRLNKELREQILTAVKNNDVAAIKELKSQIGRNRWLDRWAANGSMMADWLDPNPFIEFKG